MTLANARQFYSGYAKRFYSSWGEVSEREGLTLFVSWLFPTNLPLRKTNTSSPFVCELDETILLTPNSHFDIKATLVICLNCFRMSFYKTNDNRTNEIYWLPPQLYWLSFISTSLIITSFSLFNISCLLFAYFFSFLSTLTDPVYLSRMS